MQNKTLKLTLVALIAILMGFTTACAHRLETRHKGVDPKLQPYLNEYIDIMIENGYSEYEIPHVGIQLVETIPHGYENAAGLCARDSNTFEDTIRTIYIDREYYDMINPDDNEYDLGVESLMFHELAHCIQGADHTDMRYKRTIKVKRWSHNIRANFLKEVKYPCPDLMAKTSSGRKGTADRACYEQHRDLYLQNLSEIFALGIQY